MPDPLIGGIIAPIAGAIIQGNAAEDAANAQRDAAGQANATQLQMFREIKDLQEPWRRAGQVGLRRLLAGFGENPDAMLGGPVTAPGAASSGAWRQNLTIAGTSPDGEPLFQVGGAGPLRRIGELSYGDMAPQPPGGPSAGLSRLVPRNDFDRPTTREDLEMDPGYDFRLREAERALSRSAAARGGLLSGGFARGLTRYSQDAASQEYGNAWNRRQADITNRSNRLLALAGLGTAAGQQVGSAATNYGNAVAENQLGVGNALSAGAVARGNSWNSALGRVSNTFQNLSYMDRFGGGGW